MVIQALDHVDRCYTASDGEVIRALIHAYFARGQKVVVSFEGVGDVPSSFVNAAFVQLLNDFPADFIRSHLATTNASRQINKMISDLMAFASRESEAAGMAVRALPQDARQ